MNLLKRSILYFIIIFSSYNIYAEPIIVAVGEAELETKTIAIYWPYTKSPKLNKYIEIIKIIKNDLSFYVEDFTIIDKGTQSLNLSSLSKENTDYAFTLSEVGNETWFKLYNTKNKEEIVFEKILSNKLDKTRFLAHKISSKIFETLMKRVSIFQSKVFFVSDRNGTSKRPVKELYMMDFDGGNKLRLTHHGGTVVSPSVSNNGRRVLYSLIPKSLKNRSVRLMMYDLDTRRSKIISNKKGINAGAIFLPDENEIILTLSFQGNAELYILNLKTGKRLRLTKHFSPDVDPSISFDGKLLTFLSGRSGAAMIYTLDPTALEKSIKRISYVGKFNATPRFSPDGKNIVFSSWLDNRFDLFRLSSNGKELYRLTKDFGSNEDPSFSTDGQFIAFSSLRVISKRKADQNIYIMSSEGKIWGKITQNFGNCITPRWSN